MKAAGLVLLILVAAIVSACQQDSRDDSSIPSAHLRESYIDSLIRDMHDRVEGSDAMLETAQYAIDLSEMIHYERGKKFALLEKAKSLARLEKVEESDVILDQLAAEGPVDSLLYAEVIFFRGTNRRRTGDYDTSDSLMALAKRFGGKNHSLMMSVAMNLGSSAAVERDYLAALQELQPAEAWLYTRTQPSDSANYYNLYGTCLAFSGQSETGSVLISKARDIFQRVGDSTSQGKVIMGQMGLEILKGNLDQALDLVKEAIALSPKNGDTLLLAKYYKNKGLVLRELGRYDEALPAYWQAHRFMELAGDTSGAIRAKISLGSLYELLEDNRASIACLQEAADHPLIQDSPVTLATCKANLAHLFRISGNLEEALELGRETTALLGDKGDPLLRARAQLELGRTFMALEDTESAKRQFDMVLQQAGRPGFQALASDAHLALARLYQVSGNHGPALLHARAAIDSMGTAAHKANLMEARQILAESNFATGNLPEAVKMGTEAWELASQLKDQSRMREISERLSVFLEADGKLQEALAFARIHKDLEKAYHEAEKETVIQELRAQMELDRKNAEIGMLSTQNQVQNEKLNNRLLLIGLLALLTIGLVMFLLFWQKRIRLIRKNELLELNVKHAMDRLNLENEMIEMRLLALQARLNPHFVFNCLVVLQNLVRRGETETALQYLRDFSRLTRMVFDISQKPSLSLNEEVQFLELYVILENKRLRAAIAFEVRMSPNIDPDELFIPPLLLQPIMENCFKHGFSDQRENGRIQLQFDLQADGLHCTITDNGKGIQDSEEKNRPSGIRITRKRLSILSGIPEEARSLVLHSGLNGIGASVKFFIPLAGVHA